MRYRKKAVVVTAIQWTGDNIDELCKMGDFKLHYTLYQDTRNQNKDLGIYTLEGIMWASVGDYIVMGVRGEFYPVKPDIFKETYEEVKE